MTKAELLALAGKGKVQINGVTVEVTVRPSAGDGTPWIEIDVEQFTPYAAPLQLGQKWVEYVTDEECAEIPAWLLKYRAEALAYAELAKAKTVRLKSICGDIVVDLDWPGKKEKQYRVFKITDGIHIPGIECTIELDGIKIAPIWSYYLDCACYPTPGTRWSHD